MQPRIAVAALASVLLGACIVLPIPQKIPLTASHHGVVVDEGTDEPIEGVRIALEGEGQATTFTDARGSFKVGPVLMHSNWSGVLLLGPAESKCSDKLTFDAPGYQSAVETREVWKPGTGGCRGTSFSHRVQLRKAVRRSLAPALLGRPEAP